ncbi:Ku protein [Sporichthya polymorpha]|uniref:non-homologous end joining protein Ku n=1 Tax=Sporichthya polymorpha TaxID=35751 RepID=UPI000371555C|nr:Ku protein [Sporichthya polymorpha]
MARAIWSGSIGFGLVNVPVGLYSATEDKTVHFNQFEKGTDDRVRNKRVNEDTGKEVKYSDIVKGYDLGDGRHVIVTPDELEEVEPGRSSTIEITDFVEAADIDPVFYRKSYYLAPASDDAARPYGLLLQAMEKAGRIGIATLVMRSKQYLAAIRPQDRVLVLETMYFGDEVRDPADELPSIPRKAKFSDKDLKTAVGLIEALTTEWKPENYADTYRDRVLQLVKAKAKGREVVHDDDAEPEAEVLDLMEALRRSVDAAKSRKGAGNTDTGKLKTRKADEDDEKPAKKSSSKTAAKKTAAKKTTAKKTTAKKSAAKKTTAKKSSSKRPARKAS